MRENVSSGPGAATTRSEQRLAHGRGLARPRGPRGGGWGVGQRGSGPPAAGLSVTETQQLRGVAPGWGAQGTANGASGARYVQVGSALAEGTFVCLLREMGQS